MTDFSGLDLTPALQQAISAADYREMTAVQAASLPAILAGRDVIAQAKTGSGKTAAFALGLLKHLDSGITAVQGLVLCPTRELAEQVAEEIRRLARFIPSVKVLVLCGGKPLRAQLTSLGHAPHLVVATPGRLLDLLRRGALDLSTLRVLVLDEADRMLDMGFSADIDAIGAEIPATRQTLLFSATYSAAIRAIGTRFQRDAVEVKVTATLSAQELAQSFIEVEPAQKFATLIALLNEQGPTSCVVFCNTRHATRDLAEDLAAHGYSALALHGDLEQRERDEVLLQFANHSASVLVATDVAARGLDIKDLPVVINYEPPQDADVYIHRIGRSGRAGSKGRAFTLCSRAERARTAAIETALETTLSWRNPPGADARHKPIEAAMMTLVVDGGKQDKLRPGDLLGALTGDAGLDAADIGKIDLTPTRTYVAIARRAFAQALNALADGRIKGRRFRVRRL